MGFANKFPTSDNFTDTDYFSGVKATGNLVRFTATALYNWLTQNMPPLTIEEVDADFALGRSDVRKYYRNITSTNYTITIPNDLQVGHFVHFRQESDGHIILNEGTGVTIKGPTETEFPDDEIRAVAVGGGVINTSLVG